MALREAITTAMKEAMKAKDQTRLGTLRLILAAIKDRDIAGRTEDSRAGIADDEILGLLAKMIKSREDSIALYKQGGRPELAAAEAAEIAVIREFMPQQMGTEEASAAIDAAIAETGAGSIKDMGKVMAHLKGHFAGKMDFAAASAAVKAKLTK
jgi:uncharacterized protein